MSRRRVFFYVQHLLGIGHLRRAATITRAMAARGLDVTVASGGSEIPGVDFADARFVQLPATRAADLHFKKLLDDHGAPIDEAWKARRRETLLAAYRDSDPHVVLVELFPFGRRQMRFELLPLLDEASARERRPVIASSVRDILVAQHKPERNEEMLARVNRYFDHVLVHGDPNFIPFERTFPHARKIADKIHYTGYVVDRMGRSHGDSTAGRGEVIVSAGGGAVGLALLRDAIEARQLTSAAGRTWRVLVGVTVPEPEYREIAALDGDGVVVERARADFTTLLTNCDLSISQGGYNTLMEVLDAGTRAVIVPYAGGIETEQTLRAREMAKLGAVQVVNEDDLSPQAIASAADAALAGPPTSNAGLDTAGAEMTADLVSGWAGALDW